ncbi:hypothetical protein CVT26_004173 [Gymnopilus dilepis]|uniref:Uncharacterized protein n=1 Tax=Gymnopilus dilepis TaxID=231916 RepID=A0A409YMF7_9AGAR|nr:hypothetical protein CVT26_004173 [Gymnopilus dilepis]
MVHVLTDHYFPNTARGFRDVLSFLNLYLSPTDDPETLSVLNAQLLSSIPIAYISVTFKEEEQALVSFEAVALVYAKSIKSLKYADVRKSSRFPSHQEQYWWKVIRIDASSEEDQGVGLETLNEREGIALRDRHDQLSFRNRMS